MKSKPPKTEVTVRLSTKGRLVLPKEVRLRHRWSAGTELALEDFGDRVVLREVCDLLETSLEDLIGCAGYRGPAKTLRQMEAGIAQGR